jgi:hypothetical protein
VSAVFRANRKATDSSGVDAVAVCAPVSPGEATWESAAVAEIGLLSWAFRLMLATEALLKAPERSTRAVEAALAVAVDAATIMRARLAAIVRALVGASAIWAFSGTLAGEKSAVVITEDAFCRKFASRVVPDPEGVTASIATTKNRYSLAHTIWGAAHVRERAEWFAVVLPVPPTALESITAPLVCAPPVGV